MVFYYEIMCALVVVVVCILMGISNRISPSLLHGCETSPPILAGNRFDYVDIHNTVWQHGSMQQCTQERLQFKVELTRRKIDPLAATWY